MSKLCTIYGLGETCNLSLKIAVELTTIFKQRPQHFLLVVVREVLHAILPKVSVEVEDSRFPQVDLLSPFSVGERDITETTDRLASKCGRTNMSDKLDHGIQTVFSSDTRAIDHS